MKNRKTLFLVVGIAVVAAALFVVWRKSVKEQLILANPPIEKLLFVKKTGEEFTPEQQQSISEFKAKLLARAGLGVELTGKEREIFSKVLSEEEMLLPQGEMVLNQAILKFSAEEINLISDALKK